MIAAGTSVISSHAARKRSGSRAQSTSARISRKAAVSAPVARPPASGTRYLVANQSDGAPTTPRTNRKKPLVGSTPRCGSKALVNDAPSSSPETNTARPAIPTSAMPAACATSPATNARALHARTPPDSHHDEPRGEKRSGHEGLNPTEAAGTAYYPTTLVAITTPLIRPAGGGEAVEPGATVQARLAA